MNKFLFLFFILTFVACSSSEKDTGAYTKSDTVQNNLSKTVQRPWERVDNVGSDFALNNQVTKSFFIFNSACRKFDPSTLPNLTNSILTGINNVEFLEKSNTTHQEREAVLMIARGTVDGVERYFRILTTQKNNCIYDYALISTNAENLERDTAAFNNFIQLLKLN